MVNCPHMVVGSIPDGGPICSRGTVARNIISNIFFFIFVKQSVDYQISCGNQLSIPPLLSSENTCQKNVVFIN